MPNDCYNRVTIGADPETINYLYKKRFRFNTILPIPINANENWSVNFWGTQWDRYKYKVLKVGNSALQISFHTDWTPPFKLFNYIAETFRAWIKCEWDEEGGKAGVYLVKYNNDNLEIKDFVWDDWSIEEYNFRFN
jgi:hypothetical protein